MACFTCTTHNKQDVNSLVTSQEEHGINKSSGLTLLGRSRLDTWYFMSQMECMGGVLGMYTAGSRYSAIDTRGGERERLRVPQTMLTHKRLPSAIGRRGKCPSSTSFFLFPVGWLFFAGLQIACLPPAPALAPFLF